MPYKKQFIIIAGIWVVLVIVLAMLGMPRVIRRQEALSSEALNVRRHMEEQMIQQENIRRAQESMDSIQGQKVGVEDFLPKESNLVRELASLEKWAAELGLEIKINLSGTVAAAKPADTRTEVGLVPISVQLTGSTAAIVEFMRLLEQSTLPLVSNTVNVSVDSSSKTGAVRANLDGHVYVQK